MGIPYFLSVCVIQVPEFFTKIDMLFDIIFRHHSDNNVRKNECYVCIVTLYQYIMNSVRKRSNMSSDEIITIQQLIDVWYEKWIGLTRREGMMNYVHMLGSGYGMYYLRKKRNLYHYSNQSRGSLNNHIKRCYLTKTQRGGYIHYAGEVSTNVLKFPHTVPLTRWFQRAIMRNIRYGSKYVMSKDNNE